jgi:hypothetical protein
VCHAALSCHLTGPGYVRQTALSTPGDRPAILVKRRLIPLALFVVSQLLAFAVVSADAESPRKPNPYVSRVGLSSHTTFMNDADASAYMRRARDLGVRWVREDFAWSAIERRRGQFDWRVTDRLMRGAALNGMDVLAGFGYAPAWANGGKADDKYPPLNPRDYARAGVAVVRRYGRRGTFWKLHPKLHARPLAAIELWNEPWLWHFWKPQPDAAAYAELVRVTAPAIKSADRRIKVIASVDLQMGYSDGRDYTNGTRRNWEYGFLAQFVKLRYAYASVDGYALHPYSQRFGPYQTEIAGYGDQQQAQQWLYQKLLLARDVLRQANRFKPLWSTELGWSTAGDVDEATQSSYVRDALKRAVEEWRGFVARSFVYVLEKPHNGDYAGGYNLLRDDLSPKPGWLMLKDLLRP